MAKTTAAEPAHEAARIGVRELRNHVAAVLRRASAGERLIITVDGVPTAQLGPIETPVGGADLDQLIAAGLVAPPRRTDRADPPEPLALPVDISVAGVLDDLRGR